MTLADVQHSSLRHLLATARTQNTHVAAFKRPRLASARHAQVCDKPYTITLPVTYPHAQEVCDENKR